MATMAAQAATIVVRSEYLDDVRSALVVQVGLGGEALTANQDALISRPNYANLQDRDTGVAILREDVEMLDELLAAEGDTDLTGEPEKLLRVMEATVRVLRDQLTVEVDHLPVDLREVTRIADRIQWAAGEGVRCAEEAQ